MSVGRTADRVLKLAIAGLYFAYSAGRRPSTQPFVVLMYHSVKRHERERFARQMNQLLAAGTPVYADDDGANTDGGARIAVTFDDGYSSVLENALDILHDRSIPATVFVPTRDLGRSPGWITDPRHRDAHERLLTADELLQIERLGARVGAHGVTHRPLTALGSAEVLAELTESREVLGRVLGRDITLFALPYGLDRSTVMELAGDAGYERVFLSVPTREARQAPQVIGRVEASPTDWPLEYYLKIRGAYQWLPWAIGVKDAIRTVLRTVSLGSAPRTT